MVRKAKKNATLDAKHTLEEIRDLLFLETSNGGFYDPNKEIDSEIMGEVINKVREHYQDMFTECSLCGCLCDLSKSHLHRCWDDRLKSSE